MLDKSRRYARLFVYLTFLKKGDVNKVAALMYYHQ